MAYSITNYIVLNFETTSEFDNPDYPLEIIQFSAHIIDLETKTIRENESFNKFVRPRINKNLTQYCIEQTGIQQASVDSADEFSVVYEEFMKWVTTLFPRLIEVSLLCSTYDVICKTIQYQCLLSDILMSPLFRQYVCLERTTQYNSQLQIDTTKSYFQRATELYGVFPTGNINGNDRCLALARVVAAMLNQSIPVRVNCKLTCNQKLRGVPLGTHKLRNWKNDESTVRVVWDAALPLAHGYINNFNTKYHGICAGCNKNFSYCNTNIKTKGHQQPAPWLYENKDVEIVFARTANLC